MNLFDTLIEDVLSRNSDLRTVQTVVEKEILHHDILREMSQAGFLQSLTFIGGTCLRTCYSSPRLSEDLDFTGGHDFKLKDLQELGDTLTQKIYERYGLQVEVSEPRMDSSDTKTWKVRVLTRPHQPHLPSQKIHIDICTVSSFDRQPVMLKNHYRIDMGTSGIILYAESREEILADKFIALALRLNRIKQRDIWDILWLMQQSVELKPDLVFLKLAERTVSPEYFLQHLSERIDPLVMGQKDFLFEMGRFLPLAAVDATLKNPDYWSIVLSTLRQALHTLKNFAPNTSA